jgi:hypothetical protein
MAPTSLGDAMTDFKTGGDIAWIADAGEQP